MNTIDNIRWLHAEQQRRQRACGTVAGIVLALALWAAIIAAVVALL